MLKKVLIFFVLMTTFGGYIVYPLDVLSREKQQDTQQATDTELSPKIILMPPAKMAVVYTKGDPNAVAQRALQALYGSVFQLRGELTKKGIKFQMSAPCARWPNTLETPREEWIGIWGLSIPEEVESVPQTNPDVEVKVEVWEYGFMAQILHIGPFETEPGTIKILMDFIAESGYEIVGAHEEVYLTMPGADPQKTLIRYPVRKK